MTPEDRSAARLVARMAAGEEAALTALYDQYAQLVNAVAVRVLRDAGNAEDVVEDTFWQAWQTAGRYTAERGTVANWLVVMARSRAYDRLRAWRRRSGAQTVPPARDDLPSSALQPDVPEAHQRLAEVLARLPADQREAIELAFFDGLTHAEIAERTSSPLGTVKSRLRRALSALRQQVNMRREPRA